jgi:UDP-glucose 4-epimerase
MNVVFRREHHTMAHLITGGAGFIGCNLADYLLARGEQVTIVDNLSRPRTPLNLAWLQERYGKQLRFVQADIRDAAAMQAVIPGHRVVYHLAGQVAVTTSVRIRGVILRLMRSER